jgi:hypothetical protein
VHSKDYLQPLKRNVRPTKRNRRTRRFGGCIVGDSFVAQSADSNQENSTIDFQRSLKQKHEEALIECERLIQRFKYIADKDKRRFTLLKQFSISLTLVVTLLSALAASRRGRE